MFKFGRNKNAVQSKENGGAERSAKPTVGIALPGDPFAEIRQFDLCQRQGKRRRRALWALGLSALLWLPLGGMSILLVGTWFWNGSSIYDYGKGYTLSARAGFLDQYAITEVIQIGHGTSAYNLGTVKLKLGKDLSGAVEKLEEALRLEAPGSGGTRREPPTSFECAIRNNLAVGYELQGDERKQAGAQAQAEEIYKKAAQTLEICSQLAGGGSQNQGGDQSGNKDKGSPGKDASSGQKGGLEKVKENKDRIDEKAGNPKDLDPKTGDAKDGEGNKDGDEATKDKGKDGGKDKGTKGGSGGSDKGSGGTNPNGDDPAEKERQRKLRERQSGFEDSENGGGSDGGGRYW